VMTMTTTTTTVVTTMMIINGRTVDRDGKRSSGTSYASHESLPWRFSMKQFGREIIIIEEKGIGESPSLCWAPMKTASRFQVWR
jgi:hypothetical protein